MLYKHDGFKYGSNLWRGHLSMLSNWKDYESVLSTGNGIIMPLQPKEFYRGINITGLKQMKIYANGLKK